MFLFRCRTSLGFNVSWPRALQSLGFHWNFPQPMLNLLGFSTCLPFCTRFLLFQCGIPKLFHLYCPFAHRCPTYQLEFSNARLYFCTYSEIPAQDKYLLWLCSRSGRSQTQLITFSSCNLIRFAIPPPAGLAQCPNSWIPPKSTGEGAMGREKKAHKHNL